MRSLFALLIGCTLPLLAFGQDHLPNESSLEELFRQGIEAYQTQQYDKAKTYFQQAYGLQPENTQVLLNWGLAEFQLANRGQALACWRRALYLDPWHRAARRALEFAATKMNLNSTHDDDLFSYGFTWVAGRVTANQLLGVMAFLTILTGTTFLRFWGKRKLALREEDPLPTVSSGLVLSLIFWTGLLLISIFKVIDYWNPRATVVAKSVSVRSSPQTESPPLFELQEGSEIFLRRNSNEWTQVTQPGGMTGWVLKESVFHTSGRRPW